MMDTLEQFPSVYCDNCRKVRPMIFDVLEVNDKNDHAVADIVCDVCKSIVATLHAREGSRD